VRTGRFFCFRGLPKSRSTPRRGLGKFRGRVASHSLLSVAQPAAASQHSGARFLSPRFRGEGTTRRADCAKVTRGPPRLRGFDPSVDGVEVLVDGDGPISLDVYRQGRAPAPAGAGFLGSRRASGPACGRPTHPARNWNSRSARFSVCQRCDCRRTFQSVSSSILGGQRDALRGGWAGDLHVCPP